MIKSRAGRCESHACFIANLWRSTGKRSSQAWYNEEQHSATRFTMSDSSWQDLLSWLEKHGFDRKTLKVDLHESQAGGGRKLVATSDILPQQMLISLPNSTLLNKSTILHLYDPSVVEKLSAIQLLCLHLAIHRFNNADRDDTVEDFLPYIRTLPQDFSSVPLWREVVKDEAWLSILRQPDLIPAGLLSAIEDVSKRFWKDWKTTSDVANANSIRELAVQDFAWAWLCVNSRCIYYDLGLPTREDNITLAPIIDMGNHSPSQSTTIVQGDDDFRLLSSGYNNLHHGDWSKKTILLKKGEEVKYSYSAHSDYILFAEYGFALGMPLNTDNSLDITKRIIKLFDNLETEEETDLKKSVLEANGYWGEYHLILSEGKVDVSYRTTMALALYHMKPVQQKDQSEKRSSSPRKRNKTEENPDGGWNLQPFYDLVNGITEEISAENVRQSNETLQRLCKDIEGDCNTALTHLAGSEADKTMVETLETVWRSELWFATHFSAVETEKD